MTSTQLGSRVTLTFDNGPTPGVTERVLDELESRDLRASFFIIGQDLKDPRKRALAEEIRSRGHWIGNHTMTHSRLFGDEPSRVVAEEEIVGAQDILGELSHPDRLFRPWGNGELSDRVLSAAAVEYLVTGDFTLVLWNVVPRDWEDASGWPRTALSMIDNETWSVVVLHDLDTGAMENLPGFLNALQERGTVFTQEFPETVVPIRKGEIKGDLTSLGGSRQSY